MIKEALSYLFDIREQAQLPVVIKELSKPGLFHQVYVPGKGMVEYADFTNPVNLPVIDFSSLQAAYLYLRDHFRESEYFYSNPLCRVSLDMIKLECNPQQATAPCVTMPVRYGDDYQAFKKMIQNPFNAKSMVLFLREALYGVDVSPDLQEALRHVNFSHSQETSIRTDKSLQSLDRSLRNEIMQGNDLPEEFTITIKPLSPYPEIDCSVSITCALHVDPEAETMRYVPLAGEMFRAESTIREALTRRFELLDLDVPVIHN